FLLLKMDKNLKSSSREIGSIKLNLKNNQRPFLSGLFTRSKNLNEEIEIKELVNTSYNDYELTRLI
ncbi:MAG: hypothetical protein MHPSP_001681, partial [Paramarteilia canceri]